MKLLNKEVKKMDMKKYSTILIGLFLLTQAVFAATTAMRTLPSSAAPGSTFTVSLSLAVSGSPSTVALMDQYPAGWTVSNINAGTAMAAVPSAHQIDWLFFAQSGLASGTQTLSYQLTVPANATGTGSFIGNLTVITGNATAYSSVSGSSSISVATTTTSTTSTTTTTVPGAYVQRSMASTARMGVPVTVVLSINVDETKNVNSLGVRENVPSGWVVSSVSNNGVYTASANKIEWAFGNYNGTGIADTSISYVVTVPTTGLTVGTISTFSGVSEFYEGSSTTLETAVTGGQQTIQIVKKKSNNNEFTVITPTVTVSNQDIMITVDDKDSNRAVSGANVRVYLGKDDSGKKVAYGQTDENGTFVFSVTDAGKYAMIVQADRYKDLNVPLTVASGVPETTTTTVAPETTTTVPVTTTEPIVTTTLAPTTTTMPPATTVTTETVPTTAEVTTTVEVTTTAPANGGTGGTNMLLILVVVIIIVAAVAYFLMKGKGKANGNGNGKAAAEKPKKTEAKEE